MESNFEKIILENKIKGYQYEYYVLGKPSISDEKFDKVWDELKEKFPESVLLNQVGSDTKEGFPKAQHLMKMGSQDKFNSKEELEKWVKNKQIEFPICLQHKMDGLSVELQYKNGTLEAGITRGDGDIGDVITSNVSKMKGVPKKLKEKNFSGSIRGEIMLSKKVFDAKYKSSGFKNARNMASGLAKKKDGTGVEDLMVVSYDVVYLNKENFFKNESDKIHWLSSNMFCCVANKIVNSVEEIENEKNKTKLVKDKLSFAIDGLVLKQNKINLEDMKRARPEFQRAYKWEDGIHITNITNVEWSRSGHNYTPVAILETIEIEGTDVSRASLANIGEIKRLELKIPAKVSVSKRGMIIPKVEKVIGVGDDSIVPEPPKICEVCGEALEISDTEVVCTNVSCGGRKSHRIEKWIDKLNIKGFGPATISLLKEAKVQNIADLYADDLLDNILKNTNLKAAIKKSFSNLYAIKEVELEKFVGAFDIDNVGEKVVKLMVDAGFDSLEKLREAKEEKLVKIEGIGIDRANSLINGLKELKDEMDDVLNTNKIFIKEKTEITESTNRLLEGLKIVATGSFENYTRTTIKKAIEENGGKMQPNVSGTTDYLITNDINSGSSKTEKAKELGTKVLSEQEFINLIS